MKSTLVQMELPLFSLQLRSAECRFDSVEGIASYLKAQIESHKAARYLGTFDHYAHTSALPEGQIAADIVAAVNVIFCFGFTLQDPIQLAARPCSIGICENSDGFTISFVEAPMPVVNALMEEWANALSVSHSAETA